MRKLSFALFLLLPACAVSSSAVRPLRADALPIGPYYERASQSFVGSLMYEGGCLVFNGENGSPRLLPIWPSGSRFEESLLTFHRPSKSDQQAVVGQEIRLDGVPTSWSRLDPARFAAFQRQCSPSAPTPFFVSGIAPAN